MSVSRPNVTCFFLLTWRLHTVPQRYSNRIAVVTLLDRNWHVYLNYILFTPTSRIYALNMCKTRWKKINRSSRRLTCPLKYKFFYTLITSSRVRDSNINIFKWVIGGSAHYYNHRQMARLVQIITPVSILPSLPLHYNADKISNFDYLSQLQPL